VQFGKAANPTSANDAASCDCAFAVPERPLQRISLTWFGSRLVVFSVLRKRRRLKLEVHLRRSVVNIKAQRLITDGEDDIDCD
jgi:hypothetical protein